MARKKTEPQTTSLADLKAALKERSYTATVTTPRKFQLGSWTIEVRSLPAAVWRHVSSVADVFQPYEAARFGLVSWEGVKDGKGNDVPFVESGDLINNERYECVETDALDRLPPAAIEDIAGVVIAVSTLSQEELDALDFS